MLKLCRKAISLEKCSIRQRFGSDLIPVRTPLLFNVPMLSRHASEGIQMSSSKPLVLIADDDPAVVKMLAARVTALGHKTLTASNKGALSDLLERETPDLLLLDLIFGEHNGLEVLAEINRDFPELPVILVTGQGTIDTAVAAIKGGAFDFITKPVDVNRLKVTIQHALEKRDLKVRLERLEKHVAEEDSRQPLLGASPNLEKVRAMIATIAPTDATVLIEGESGTGKEVVARAIHSESTRSRGPFIALNMAALPTELVESTLFGHEKGAFTGAETAQAGACENANDGTLFLDEMGEMPLELQAKLLRFLQERTIQRVGSSKAIKVNARVIAATNRDLMAQVKAGRFREDLYYRLNVFPIHLPPLRERKGDVLLLAERFLRRMCVRYRKNIEGFSPAARLLLERHAWPGNVRELENLVERMALLCQGQLIETDLLPAEITRSQPAQSPSPREEPETIPTARPSAGSAGTAPPVPAQSEPLNMEDLEKQAILQALERARGNVREAARQLGLGHATVYRRIKRYGISLDDQGRLPSLDQPG